MKWRKNKIDNLSYVKGVKQQEDMQQLVEGNKEQCYSKSMFEGKADGSLSFP